MEIFKLLKSDSYYGFSENIEIAKGKYKICESWKEGFEQIKRHYKYITRIKE